MILHFPEYYNDFKCIASKCPDSCCTGWRNIQIDEVTYEKYVSLKDGFSKKILDNIKNIDGQFFFKLDEGNCPFLNSEKLCDIYVQEGEDYLCTTCKTYPRFVYGDDDDTYIAMTMSCPEIAGMIIDRYTPVKYYVCRNDKVYQEMFDLQEMLYYDSHELWEKLAFVAIIKEYDSEYDVDYAEAVYDSLSRVEGNDELRSEIIYEFLTLFYRLSKDTKGYTFLRECIKGVIGKAEINYNIQVENITNIYNSYRNVCEEDIIIEFVNFICYGLYRGKAARYYGDEFLANYFTVLVAGMSIFTLQGWYYKEHGEVMSKDKRIELFHCYSKVFEHSAKMRERTWEKFDKEGYIGAGVIVAILAPVTF